MPYDTAEARVNTLPSQQVHPVYDTEPIQFFRLLDPEDFVTLYINPRRLRVSVNKLINKLQTTARWVFQFWGTDTYEIQYDGITGYMNVFEAQRHTSMLLRKGGGGTTKDDPLLSSPSVPRFSPYDTPAYMSLEKLQLFYEEPDITNVNMADLSTASAQEVIDKLRIGMRYREELFIGHFLNFTFEEREDSPWQWFYQMQFQADYRRGPHRSFGESDLLALAQLQRDSFADTNFAGGVREARLALQRKTFVIAKIDGRLLYLHGLLGEYKVGFEVEVELVSQPAVKVKGRVKSQSQEVAKANEDPALADPNTVALVSGYGPYTVIICSKSPSTPIEAGARVRVTELSSDYRGVPVSISDE